jgi:hypothetical protein
MPFRLERDTRVEGAKALFLEKSSKKTLVVKAAALPDRARPNLIAITIAF